MDEWQTQIAEHLRTPSGAVDAVNTVRNKDDMYLLNAIVNRICEPGLWICLRDAGVVDLFLDLILLGTSHPKPGEDLNFTFSRWSLSVQGLFNSMVAVQHYPGGFQDSENHKVMSKLFQKSTEVFRRLGDEKEFLCGSDPHAEDVRNSVVRLIQAIWYRADAFSPNLNDFWSDLRASRVVDLSTWCWLSGTTNKNRSIAAQSLSDVLAQPESTKAVLDQVVTASGSYEHLIQACHLVLQDDAVVDEYLGNHLEILARFIVQNVHYELKKRFAARKTYVEITSALRRHMAHTNGGEEHWRVLRTSGVLVANIVSDAVSPVEELEHLIADNSFIPMVGGVLICCARANEKLPSWSALLTLLKHACTCTSSDCNIRTSPGYVSALRTHLSWRWWPTLLKLHSISSEVSSQFQKELILLGRTAGLNEVTERKKHENGEGIRGCWSVECVKLVESDSALSKCSRCKKALYCSTECQNKDWNSHKKQCATWRAAALVH